MKSEPAEPATSRAARLRLVDRTRKDRRVNHGTMVLGERNVEIELRRDRPERRLSTGKQCADDVGLGTGLHLRAVTIAELLTGESPGIRRVRALVMRLGPSMLPIHIHGPSGAGKEMVARALHAASGCTGKMVALNVCAIAEGIFEATIFGHVRGSYTGAVTDEEGVLAEANEGTVFLDEIGGLSLAGQAKLLRAIELQEFRPVGGRRDRRSQFRVLSATNDDLELQVERGAFRADLLHRLRGAVISVPALSERQEDIDLLARTFANRHRSGSGDSMEAGAIAELERRAWPGNVRELQFVVQCAAALAGGDRITVASIVEALELRRIPTFDERARSDAESRELLSALDANAWDIDGAAGAMNVHRATVYRRMRRLGLRASPERKRVTE